MSKGWRLLIVKEAESIGGTVEEVEGVNENSGKWRGYSRQRSIEEIPVDDLRLNYSTKGDIR